MKKFYAILKLPRSEQEYFTCIEADLHQDAKVYASVFWGFSVRKVLSSGSFWQYKRNNPDIREFPEELNNG